TLELPDQLQMPELPRFSSRLGAPIAVLKPRRSKKPSQVSGNDEARLDAIKAEHAAEQRRQQATEAQQANAPGEQTSFYDQVGGEPTFRKLAYEFYRQVEADPEFKAMYPETDVGPAEERLRRVLIESRGGQTASAQLGGDAQMKGRHMPLRVDSIEREAWFT